MTTTEWTKGEILWFDVSSGEGQVRSSENNEIYYLHGSCLKGVDLSPFEKHGVVHNVDIDFTLYVNIYSAQVEMVRLPLKH